MLYTNDLTKVITEEGKEQRKLNLKTGLPFKDEDIYTIELNKFNSETNNWDKIRFVKIFQLTKVDVLIKESIELIKSYNAVKSKLESKFKILQKMQVHIADKKGSCEQLNAFLVENGSLDMKKSNEFTEEKPTSEQIEKIFDYWVNNYPLDSVVQSMNNFLEQNNYGVFDKDTHKLSKKSKVSV